MLSRSNALPKIIRPEIRTLTYIIVTHSALRPHVLRAGDLPFENGNVPESMEGIHSKAVQYIPDFTTADGVILKFIAITREVLKEYGGNTRLVALFHRQHYAGDLPFDEPTWKHIVKQLDLKKD